MWQVSQERKRRERRRGDGAELPIPDGSGGLSRAGSSAPAHGTAVYLRQETLG
jgi:hypothetical protein